MTCYLHPAVEKGEQKQKLNILESTSRRLVFNIPNTLQVTDFGQIIKKIVIMQGTATCLLLISDAYKQCLDPRP